MSRQEQLQNASKKITYWNVVEAFNNLNKHLGGEYYASSKSLITPEGEKVPGFVYTGAAAGFGIRNILDSLNIRCITLIKSGSGVEEQSEIHIVDPASQERMLDILEKCGDFYSNVFRKLNTSQPPFRNPLFQQIR